MIGHESGGQGLHGLHDADPRKPVIVRSAEQMDAIVAAQKTVVANSQAQADVVANVLNERERQDAKWGPVPRLDHDFGKWLKILMEEIGEASAADLEVDFYEGEIDPYFIQMVDEELTQAAAVLVAQLEHRAAIREQQQKGPSIMERYSPGFDEQSSSDEKAARVRREWEELAK